MSKKLMTIHQIFISKKIYWIETYKTLLKYVSREYKDIFQPIVIGKGSGKRYFVRKEKVDEFVKMFENNKL